MPWMALSGSRAPSADPRVRDQGGGGGGGGGWDQTSIHMAMGSFNNRVFCSHDLRSTLFGTWDERVKKHPKVLTLLEVVVVWERESKFNGTLRQGQGWDHLQPGPGHIGVRGAALGKGGVT